MTTRRLAGTWAGTSPRATVYSVNPTDDYFQEVEIRLRSSVAAHSCDGYEVFWRCSKSDAAYAEIVRWNGKIADFTSLALRVGPEFGVRHGDIVEATIVGNMIRSFVNGVEVLSATDVRFPSGARRRVQLLRRNTNVDRASSFEVDTYDD
jgi:hypothetical protein